MKNILIVEDEKPIRTMVGYALSQAGYSLTEAGDTQEAHECIADEKPDLILMDWMLPGQNGAEMTKYLKQDIKTRHIPIIMLTALNSEQDKIKGLNIGADDYISKPFSPGELVARIGAVIRRFNQTNSADSVLSCDQLTLDPVSYRVCVGDEVLKLGPTEYRLLNFFMLHPDRVYSREQLLDNVWGQNVYVEERTVDVHILRLRQNLMPYGYDGYIQTVRGAGYRFTVEPDQTKH